MVEKLKSITKGIRWSLAFKASLVALAWYFLPEWIAWVLGVFFYFSSMFGARHMGLPVFATFVLAHFLGGGVAVALLLGATLFLILGLKELVFIDRRVMGTAMIFLILFMAGLLLYENSDAWSAWMPVKTFLFVWLFWGLTRGFLNQKEEKHDGYIMALGISSFLLWEIATIMAFIPFDSLYQSAITIFTSFVFFEWLVSYADGKLAKNKILFYVSLMFMLATLIFSFAKWGL